jgi:hypothetical protein
VRRLKDGSRVSSPCGPRRLSSFLTPDTIVILSWLVRKKKRDVSLREIDAGVKYHFPRRRDDLSRCMVPLSRLKRYAQPQRNTTSWLA